MRNFKAKDERETEIPLTELLSKEIDKGELDLKALHEAVNDHVKENINEMASQVNSLTQHIFNHYDESIDPAEKQVVFLDETLHDLRKTKQNAQERLKRAEQHLKQTKKENEELQRRMDRLKNKLKLKFEQSQMKPFLEEFGKRVCQYSANSPKQEGKETKQSWISNKNLNKIL